MIDIDTTGSVDGACAVLPVAGRSNVESNEIEKIISEKVDKYFRAVADTVSCKIF